MRLFRPIVAKSVAGVPPSVPAKALNRGSRAYLAENRTHGFSSRYIWRYEIRLRRRAKSPIFRTCL